MIKLRTVVLELAVVTRSMCVRVYGAAENWGWHQFVLRRVLKSLYVTNGSFTIACRIKVLQKDPLDVPPPDIGSHLGRLLECPDGGGSDVTFVLDGEEFPAHRAVLAARSPVFMAQLLGSMADAKMPSITLLDITAATFKALLRFIYTDDLLEAETKLKPKLRPKTKTKTKMKTTQIQSQSRIQKYKCFRIQSPPKMMASLDALQQRSFKICSPRPTATHWTV